MHMWMATYDNGLAATHYGPCKVRALAADRVPVEIACRTNYPFNEVIEMSVNPAREATFPLSLRIPGWCGGPSELSVNGVAVQAATTRRRAACGSSGPGSQAERDPPAASDVGKRGNRDTTPMFTHLRDGLLRPAPVRTADCGTHTREHARCPPPMRCNTQGGGLEDGIVVERQAMFHQSASPLEVAPTRRSDRLESSPAQGTHLRRHQSRIRNNELRWCLSVAPSSAFRCSQITERVLNLSQLKKSPQPWGLRLMFVAEGSQSEPRRLHMPAVSRQKITRRPPSSTARPCRLRRSARKREWPDLAPSGRSLCVVYAGFRINAQRGGEHGGGHVFDQVAHPQRNAEVVVLGDISVLLRRAGGHCHADARPPFRDGSFVEASANATSRSGRASAASGAISESPCSAAMLEHPNQD